MKYLVSIIVCFFVLNGISQTGTIIVNCLDDGSELPTVTCIKVKSDTVILAEGCSEIDGTKKFSNLPIGLLVLGFSSKGKVLPSKLVFVQENQVLQVTVRINDIGYTSIADGQTFEKSVLGRSKLNNSIRLMDGDLPVLNLTRHDMRNTVSIDAVMVTAAAFKHVRSNFIGYSLIRREDIRNMPLRSATSIASTFGGVNKNESTGLINIRGARSDANTYYIDGFRVNNLDGVPKSFIGSIKVYTGGIPANFGDVTGGVISLESRTMKYQPRLRSSSRSPYPNSISLEPAISNEFNLDRFAPIYENDFRSSIGNPNSTFSIDVDRASWSFVKNQFKYGYRITRDAVKLEEIVNAFNYVDIEVPEEEMMQVEMKRSTCAWNDEHELVSIHLQAQDIPKNIRRKPHNFVFLIDVSGSMKSDNKLKLLRKGLKNFVETLEDNDRVSIVTYAGYTGIALEPTLCSEKYKIIHALYNLTAAGSTNGIGGVQSAYELAEQNYDTTLNNRIILCTDGDFNVGISTTAELEEYIATKRGMGIYLTALGFGMRNYRNDVLESLADRGDGNHFYINDYKEMNKVLVEGIGNLVNIARDVKLNVEFNPKFVSEYRLIGYENRLLKPEDFTDDTKDAGEIGYGHSVTAVYEIIPGKGKKEKSSFVKSSAQGNNNSDLAIVKLRYKSFEDSLSVERQFELPKKQSIEKNELLNVVVSMGLLLRNSAFKGTMNVNELYRLSKSISSRDKDVVELKQMIKRYHETQHD